jgi:hypothetical protein
MAKSREATGNMQITTPGERRLGFFGSFVVPFLIVVVIVLVTVFFLVKTAGGKEFIAARVGKYLVMDIELDSTRIGWPYVLVLEGLSAKEKDVAEVALTAESVRLSYDFRMRKHISVSRGELIILQNCDGDWLPHVFEKLGDVPAKNITQLADTLDLFDKKIVLDITDSIIRWVDKAGNENDAVSGLYFKMLPVKIEKYDMDYFSLSARSGMIDGKKFHNIEREWLASKENSYLGLSDGEVDGDVSGLPFTSAGETK